MSSSSQIELDFRIYPNLFLKSIAKPKHCANEYTLSYMIQNLKQGLPFFKSLLNSPWLKFW